MSDTLVLCYHAVSPRWQMPYSLTPAVLRQAYGVEARIADGEGGPLIEVLRLAG